VFSLRDSLSLIE